MQLKVMLRNLNFSNIIEIFSLSAVILKLTASETFSVFCLLLFLKHMVV